MDLDSAPRLDTARKSNRRFRFTRGQPPNTQRHRWNPGVIAASGNPEQASHHEPMGTTFVLVGAWRLRDVEDDLG